MRTVDAIHQIENRIDLCRGQRAFLKRIIQVSFFLISGALYFLLGRGLVSGFVILILNGLVHLAVHFYCRRLWTLRIIQYECLRRWYETLQGAEAALSARTPSPGFFRAVPEQSGPDSQAEQPTSS